MNQDVPAYESYSDQKQRLAVEQAGMSKEQLLAALPGEYKLDLDSLTPQDHVWVERGIVVVCEGANHPTHRHPLKKGKNK